MIVNVMVEMSIIVGLFMFIMKSYVKEFELFVMN